MYYHFVDELVNQDEVCAKEFFFETTTEIVYHLNKGVNENDDYLDNSFQQFEEEGGDQFPFGGSEDKEQLISFYINKLHTCSLLLKFNHLRKIYKEGFH